MTAVYFLFLVHLSLGLLLALPLVPEQAGARFFKFCSGTAVFAMTAGLWLRYRRLGLDDPGLMGVILASIIFTVLYNRARHFGWSRLTMPFLSAAIVTGLAGVFLAASGGARVLTIASDFTSILLLGGAASAMILGHWYLVVLDLPIAALRRLTVMLVTGLALRSAVVGFALMGPLPAAYEDARLVATGLWSADGVFIWMRLLFGILGPLSLIWFIWKTVEIRSTQSATGILYVQLFLVMAGELLAKYLRVAVGFPL